jgi:hypothetical protein
MDDQGEADVGQFTKSKGLVGAEKVQLGHALMMIAKGDPSLMQPVAGGAEPSRPSDVGSRRGEREGWMSTCRAHQGRRLSAFRAS